MNAQTAWANFSCELCSRRCDEFHLIHIRYLLLPGSYHAYIIRPWYRFLHSSLPVSIFTWITGNKLESYQQRDHPEHETHEIAPLYLPPPQSPAFNLRLMRAGLKRKRSTSGPSSMKPRRSVRLRKITDVHILEQDSPLYREDLIKKSCIPRTTQQQMKQSLKENEDVQHKVPTRARSRRTSKKVKDWIHPECNDKRYGQLME